MSPRTESCQSNARRRANQNNARHTKKKARTETRRPAPRDTPPVRPRAASHSTQRVAHHPHSHGARNGRGSGEACGGRDGQLHGRRRVEDRRKREQQKLTTEHSQNKRRFLHPGLFRPPHTKSFPTFCFYRAAGVLRWQAVLCCCAFVVRRPCCALARAGLRWTLSQSPRTTLKRPGPRGRRRLKSPPPPRGRDGSFAPDTRARAFCAYHSTAQLTQTHRRDASRNDA